MPHGNRGGGEVWVAAGTYDEPRSSIVHREPSDSNTGSLMMREGVHLYGGFTGVETSREQRDWEAHVTIIEGSTARDGAAAFHVVVGADNATLDGFTVTGGYTDSEDSRRFAEGAGIFCKYDSPILRNCVIAGNSARHGGGGIHLSDAFADIRRCWFEGNTAEGDGGAMSFVRGELTVANCVFWRNSGQEGGGVCADYMAPASFMNCTFAENTARGRDRGGAIGAGGYRAVDPRIVNCILYGNTPDDVYPIPDDPLTITYSCLGGGIAGEGNIDADPLFVDLDRGDLRLRDGSPCIDAETGVGIPQWDIEDRERPQLNGVDMGAYEFERPCDVDGEGHVNAVDIQLVVNSALGSAPPSFLADVNGDNVVNALDVQLVLNTALNIR